MIKLKRMYNTPSADDGQRFLVERLWPRGVKRGVAHLSGWLKELARSSALRRWFGHDMEHWGEFQQRYTAELQEADKLTLLRHLAATARHGTVTLVFAAKDTQRNSAVVLKQVLSVSRSTRRIMIVQSVVDLIDRMIHGMTIWHASPICPTSRISRYSQPKRYFRHPCAWASRIPTFVGGRPAAPHAGC
jgi:uncharacterized protein YeaO (DUF488 family)